MAYGTDAQARQVLAGCTTWAVVGLGAGPARTALHVAAWLQRQGKRIVPVHPAGGQVLGERVYPSIGAIPFPVEVVDVFRRADLAGAHVYEAIAIGAAAAWLQLGVIDESAYERGRAAGLTVLMDRCPHIDGPALLGWPA